MASQVPYTHFSDVEPIPQPSVQQPMIQTAVQQPMIQTDRQRAVSTGVTHQPAGFYVEKVPKKSNKGFRQALVWFSATVMLLGFLSMVLESASVDTIAQIKQNLISRGIAGRREYVRKAMMQYGLTTSSPTTTDTNGYRGNGRRSKTFDEYVDDLSYRNTLYLGQFYPGIWVGLTGIATGILGLLAGFYPQKRGLMVATMVLCIVYPVVLVTQLAGAGITLARVNFCFDMYIPSDRVPYYGYICDDTRWTLVRNLQICLIVFAVIQLIVSITASAFTCRLTCCNKKKVRGQPVTYQAQPQPASLVQAGAGYAVASPCPPSYSEMVYTPGATGLQGPSGHQPMVNSSAGAKDLDLVRLG